MKPRKVLLITAAIIMSTGASAQRVNRGDVCQNIPNLSTEQTQKVNNLGVTHQKTMDGLRAQFYSENDAAKASEFKTQMNTEMAKFASIKDYYNNAERKARPHCRLFFIPQSRAYHPMAG